LLRRWQLYNNLNSKPTFLFLFLFYFIFCWVIYHFSYIIDEMYCVTDIIGTVGTGKKSITEKDPNLMNEGEGSSSMDYS
jgi:hypothetical protein